MANVNRNKIGGRTMSRQRGISLIELALVLPILLLLTFGVIEFGWMFLTTSHVTNAARNGVRVAIRPSSSSADVQEAVDFSMEAAGLADSGYSVTIEPAEVADLEPGTTIQVTVSVSYSEVELTGFPLPVPENLQVSVTMVKEGPP